MPRLKESAADLHTHTTYSDGALTPAELSRAAASLGLAAIAVTDHDNTDGIAPARQEGNRLGLEVIAGVELSCQSMNDSGDDGELHLLGYFVDPENKEMQKSLKRLRDIRAGRADLILKKLLALGIRLSPEKIHAQAKGKSVGRPHIAQALVEAGHAESIEEAFQKFIKKGRPAYVERPLLTAEEAIDLVRSAGGAPVVAHPRFGGPRRPRDWARLVERGLVGIEARHPDHPPHDVKTFEKLAKERGLIVTGGSDFHGAPGRAPLGACRVALDVLSELKKRL